MSSYKKDILKMSSNYSKFSLLQDDSDSENENKNIKPLINNNNENNENNTNIINSNKHFIKPKKIVNNDTESDDNWIKVKPTNNKDSTKIQYNKKTKILVNNKNDFIEKKEELSNNTAVNIEEENN